MPPQNNAKDGLPPVFDDLSFLDRCKLRIATMACIVTYVAKEDTKAHPERAPLYVGFLALLGAAATISPVPGTTEAILFSTIAIVKKSRTPWAEWVDGKMKEAFNKENMVERRRRYIEPDQKREGHFRVKNGDLLGGTFKCAASNTLGMLGAGFSGLGRVFAHKPPGPA